MWQSEFWKIYTYEAAHNFCIRLCFHLVKTSLDCTGTLHCSRALQKGDSQGIVRKRCVSSFTCVRTSKQCTPAWWRRCCVWVKSLYQYTNYGLERFQSQSVLVEFGKSLRCETIIRTLESHSQWYFVTKIVLELWEKNVLVFEKNFWNLRLKAENLQIFWDH